MADRLADVADGLYGVPPADFIAQRTARVKDVAGDKELAARVKELRKPAPAAWVVNLLARSRRDDLEQLLDLGAELRAAQAALNRDEITRLAKERRTRVTALAREGARLASDAGQTTTPAVVDAVAATLDAGLADVGAADAIRTGRLLRPLQTIGFEPVDLAEAIAVPEAGSRAAQKRTAPEAQRPHAIDDADAELLRARKRADAVVARAEHDAAEAAEGFGDLEVRLREARKAVAAAEREAEALERQRDSAGRAHEKARTTLDTARARRRDLGG
ncbi:hypothetical protein [Pseudolysinimonas sp.]|uniref:hypothetical protein n=1 Tax=Pseudolysinimonas sp. TaxID=2680009 RepID=UPI00286BD64E|nr:hypothetical protein [Pseudolysinimonas sp.]